MIGVVRHVRYFVRGLTRHPILALTMIASLAIGIGANTVMFGVIRRVLLDGLDVSDPASLVLLQWRAPDFPAPSLSGNVSFDEKGGSAESTSFSLPEYRTFLRESRSLDGLIAFAAVDRMNLSVDGKPLIAGGEVVSGNYYPFLGVRAARGRTILPGDDDPAAPPVAMLSYAYWSEAFEKSDRAIGSTIVVNGRPFTIVGVEPRAFAGTVDVGTQPRVILPVSAGPVIGDPSFTTADSWWLQLIGRRRPGSTNAAVASEASLLLQRAVRSSNPSFHGIDRIRVEALPGARGLDASRSLLREPILILAGAVGLVLLMACANVAGLLLARATSRRGEIAVRISAGATRGSLMAQMLLESCALAVLGGAAGLLLAWWIRPLVPAVLARPGGALEMTVPLDGRVMLFTAGVCLATGILFGLVPALRATRVDLSAVHKDAVTVGSRSGNRAGNVLVVVQIALSIVLLAGSALFLRSLRNVVSADRGFDARDVLLFRVDPTLNGYAGPKLARYYDRVLESVRALPGVRIATPTAYTLVGGRSAISTLFVDGRKQQGWIYRHTVGEQFLDAMRIPLLRGRGIVRSDDGGAPRVAVVSANFADRYFPHENPIGRRIGLSKQDPGGLEIVGVAGNARYTSMSDEMPPTVYLAYRQNLDRIGAMSFVVRTARDPSALAVAVRDAVERIDPAVPVFEMRTQQEQIDDSIRRERTLAALATFFGAVALALSCIGLYALASFVALRRTRELAVRFVLGARPVDVALAVLKRALLLAAAGVVAGTAASLALTRFVRSMLVGIGPDDPGAIAAAAAVVIFVSLLATALPARRASRMNPTDALRAH